MNLFFSPLNRGSIYSCSFKKKISINNMVVAFVSDAMLYINHVTLILAIL